MTFDKKSPIVILAFNRPDMLKRLLERIQGWAPDSLWIIIDGPRNADESILVDQVKAYIEQIEWCSKIYKNYSLENMGCHKRVSSGLSWFFSQNTQGIILEDDCIPLESFFPYCEELLERYRDNKDVTAIEGTHRLDANPALDESYFFSTYHTFHGWATWNRAWENYNDDVSDADLVIKRKFRSIRPRLYWSRMFKRVADGRRSSWGYRWMLSNWRIDGLSAVPSRPLVENIGYGEDSTHTKGASYRLMPAENLSFPLKHPKGLNVDSRLDNQLEDCSYSRSVFQRIRWFGRRFCGLDI